MGRFPRRAVPRLLWRAAHQVIRTFDMSH
jgi:hypothetical protein